MYVKFKDYVNGSAHLPDEVAELIPRDTPFSGPGSRLGGYIIICEVCKTPFFNSKSNRKFCSKECKHLYEEKMHQEKYVIGLDKTEKKRIIRTRRCVCGKQFETTINAIERGRGVFCSRECSVRSLHHDFGFTWSYTCRHCGTRFKSALPEAYCSLECAYANHGKFHRHQAIPDNLPYLAKRYHTHCRLRDQGKNYSMGLISVGNYLCLYDYEPENALKNILEI